MTDTRPDVAVEEAVQDPRSKRLVWALVLISVAQLMVVLDGTIVNIALPYIQHDLGIATADLRWVVTGYALAFGSLLLLGGPLGRLYGRRKVFMVGLVVFGVASLLGGLATSEGLLLAARGLQGLGAPPAPPPHPAPVAPTLPPGPRPRRTGADRPDVPRGPRPQPRLRGVRRDVGRRRGRRPAPRRLADRP